VKTGAADTLTIPGCVTRFVINSNWIFVLCCCVGSLWSQQVKPDHIIRDSIGESVDDYIANNPTCRVLSGRVHSSVQPKQTERTVLCARSGHGDSLFREEDNAIFYEAIPLRAMAATFLAEDGLVMLAFQTRRSDYDGLTTTLFHEFGMPYQVSSWGKETVSWDDGVSRIDLQYGDASASYSYLFLVQDAYFGRLVVSQAATGELLDARVVALRQGNLVLQRSDGSQINVKVLGAD
jgi:hypothetical protein